MKYYLITYDKERYDFVINSQIFGGENLALFQQMWTALSKDPQKVIQFMAVFSTGSSEIEDYQKKINELEKGGVTKAESRAIRIYKDQIKDITKGMLGAGKVIQDTNTVIIDDNPDVKKAGTDAFMHWRFTGLKEGRKWPLNIQQNQAVEPINFKFVSQALCKSIFIFSKNDSSNFTICSTS